MPLKLTLNKVPATHRATIIKGVTLHGMLLHTAIIQRYTADVPNAMRMIVGPFAIEVAVTMKGIAAIRRVRNIHSESILSNKKFIHIRRAFDAYLRGDRDALSRLSLDIEGTPFQRRVWHAVQAIPAGKTCTYAEIAARIDSPKAVRAVGTALGKNPVCIVVPCHRVVPRSGGIGSYAYGTAMKRWLLEHEGVVY